MKPAHGASRIAAYALLLGALASTVVPLLPDAEALPVWKHHLVHALVLALAAGSGLLFAHLSEPKSSQRHAEVAGWAIAAALMPVLSMFLMWPTTYDWLERHPFAHGVEHLCFVALGFLAAYGGEKYVPGIGWISGIATVLTAIVASGGFGVMSGS